MYLYLLAEVVLRTTQLPWHLQTSICFTPLLLSYPFVVSLVFSWYKVGIYGLSCRPQIQFWCFFIYFILWTVCYLVCDLLIAVTSTFSTLNISHDNIKVLEENIGRNIQTFHTAIFSPICPLEQGTWRKE